MTSTTDATVMREFGRIVREGRGFSLEELKKAGIDTRQARKFGLPVDRLRKSSHQENVDKLANASKQIAAKSAAKRQAAPKQTAKKAEEAAPAEKKKAKSIKLPTRAKKKAKKE